jgi:restriction endonuclease S subunit
MCGCDTDPRLAMIAKLNLFLELGACIHPGNISGVLQRDSLAEGLLQGKYDVIVANVPFGIQGLSAEGCCATVKELNIPGVQPEPLFLQLIMASLNVGGRSAVVVPEGMLFKKSKQHVKTRLYLLDHFELHRVVTFDGKGKPPVLFFENTGQATQSIQFWSVHKTIDGEVSEKLVCTVARSKLDAAFSLDVRHYAESAKPISVAFPVVRLEDIAVHKNGKTLKGSEKDESAAFDVMGGGMDYNGLYVDFNREGTTISVSKSGASAGFVKLHTRKFWAGDCLTVAPKDASTCDVRYLYYFLKLETNFKEKSHGTTIPHCDWGSIKDTFVPLPPLTVQKEVAYALDRVYTPGTVELAEILMGVSDGPQAEVLLRKALQSVGEIHARTIGDVQFQMTALMNASGLRVELRPLSETCSVSFGERITEKKDVGTMFPVYGSGGESFKTDRFNRTGRTCKLGRFAVSEANMVMMVNGPYWLMDSGFTVQSKDEATLMTAFLHYYFATHKKELAGLSAGSCQKNIDMDAFYAMAIPVPPACVQHDTVARLDVLQAHLESLKAMVEHSDSNARIILASYLGAESPKMEQTQDEISL